MNASGSSTFLKIFSVFLGALILGCGSGHAYAADSDASLPLKPQSRIGVIPLVGAELELQRVGVTVFGNKHNFANVARWGLNDALFDNVTEALGGRYALSRVTPSDGAFSALYDVSSKCKWDDVAEEVKRIVADCSCDALLFITRTRRGDAIGGTNQQLSGLGWYWSEKMRYTVAYAAYHLWLIDAHTQLPIKDATSSLPSTGFFSSSPLPVMRFAGLEWPFDAKGPSDIYDRDKIVPKLKELVHASMPETLRRVGLLEAPDQH